MARAASVTAHGCSSRVPCQQPVGGADYGDGTGYGAVASQDGGADAGVADGRFLVFDRVAALADLGQGAGQRGGLGPPGQRRQFGGQRPGTLVGEPVIGAVASGRWIAARADLAKPAAPDSIPPFGREFRECGTVLERINTVPQPLNPARRIWVKCQGWGWGRAPGPGLGSTGARVPTAPGLLQTLEARELVSQDPDIAKYSLGPACSTRPRLPGRLGPAGPVAAVGRIPDRPGWGDGLGGHLVRVTGHRAAPCVPPRRHGADPRSRRGDPMARPRPGPRDRGASVTPSRRVPGDDVLLVLSNPVADPSSMISPTVI